MAEIDRTPYKIFGKTLKRLRGKQTQRAIAEKAGIGTHAYQLWEYGDRAPESNLSLYRLMEALAATTDERLALVSVWNDIQTQIKLAYPDRLTDPPMLNVITLEPEIRELQTQIDAIRATDQEDGHRMVCGALNAAQRVSRELKTWRDRNGC